MTDTTVRAAFDAKHPFDEVPGALREAFFELFRNGWQAALSAPPAENAITMVHTQAEDDGLWFNAQTAAEGYLQQELRRLHAAVEKDSAEDWNRRAALASPLPAPNWQPVPPRARIKPTHEAADAFWKYWRENGETHKHGYYESTWGAINKALAHGWDAAAAPLPQPPEHVTQVQATLRSLAAWLLGEGQGSQVPLKRGEAADTLLTAAAMLGTESGLTTRPIEARPVPTPSVEWREPAAHWLRRKAEESRPEAAKTGWANPAHFRPDTLMRLAEELDAEQESTPFGDDSALEAAPQAPEPGEA